LCSVEKCDEFLGIASRILEMKKEEACCRIIENPKAFFGAGVDV
jgi:hypothetical protein